MKPVEEGGLDLKSLRLVNLSLIAKWLWRFYTEQEALWRKVICNLYGSDGGQSNPRHLLNSIWGGVLKGCKQIQELNVEIFNSMKRVVKNGENTLFWVDKWLQEDLCLKNMFPRLYALERVKVCSVSDRWMQLGNGWGACWDWTSSLRGRAIDELEKLEDLLKDVRLMQGKKDDWKWSLDPSGVFSSKALSKILHKEGGQQSNNWGASSWVRWMPAKVNICVWRAMLNRLPTLDNLTKRGIVCSRMLCNFCGMCTESVDHIFFQCDKSIRVWKKVCAWWGVKKNFGFGWEHDMLSLRKKKPLNSVEQVMLGVGFCVVWHIWGWRNKFIFGDPEERAMILADDGFPLIQSRSFIWVKYRSKLFDGLWEEWISNPRAKF